MSSGIGRYEIIKDSVDLENFRYLFYYLGQPTYKLDTLHNVFFIPFSLDWYKYNLDADSGDTWTVEPEDTTSPGAHPRMEALVKNKYPSIVFGRPTVLMEIEYYELNWGDTVINDFAWKINTETLAAGFGLVLNWYEEPGDLNQILRGCVIDGDTFGIITAIKEDIKLPEEFYLSQNYPNPFNPSTNIKYAINSRQNVSLVVYDVLGNKVAVLVNEEMPAGEYEVTFNGSGLASGVYVYRLKTNGKIISKKMILIK